MNQRGFATLEVILMVIVIGILASIAVPRFNAVTASANTAKIQSNLSALDAAIAIYYVNKGTYPTKVTELNEYLREAVEDPSGKAFIGGEEKDLTEATYEIHENQATLKIGNDYKTASDLTKTKNSDTNSTTPSDG